MRGSEETVTASTLRAPRTGGTPVSHNTVTGTLQRIVSSWRRTKPFHILLALLLYLFFAIFLFWPIVQIVRTGFVRRDGGLTLEYIRLIFADPVLVRGLMNATTVA